MSLNRCMLALSRVPVQHRLTLRVVPTTTCVQKLTVPVRSRENGFCGIFQGRSVSSGNSSRPPDTSLFVPVSPRTESAEVGAVGLELSQPLDKGNPSKHDKK